MPLLPGLFRLGLVAPVMVQSMVQIGIILNIGIFSVR